MNHKLDIIERKITATITQLKQGKITPEESEMDFMLKELKPLDEAAYEIFNKRYEKFKKILEKNEFIAKFDGWSKNEQHQWTKKSNLIILNGEPFSESWEPMLQFNKSWDWLMPVVEKINSFTNYDLKIHISPNVHGVLLGNSLFDNKEEKTITQTWKAVIGFIEFYNRINQL